MCMDQTLYTHEDVYSDEDVYTDRDVHLDGIRRGRPGEIS